MSKGMLGTLPLSAVRGPRDQLEECLAGEEGERWLAALKLFLRKENPWPKPSEIPDPHPRFAIWKTIPVHEASRNELVAKLMDVGIGFDAEARAMIYRDSFQTAPCQYALDLTLVTAFALGLGRGASFETFLCRAVWYGLELCPPSLALHFALAHHSPSERDIGYWFMKFAMDPIGGTTNFPSLFRAHYRGGRMNLDAVSMTMSSSIGPAEEYCFVLPRKGENGSSK